MVIIMIKVVAALIEKNNEILIAQRSTGDESVLGKWEFPGGKVEPNEREEDALEREILEEFEISIKTLNFITNNIHVTPKKTIDLRLYKCSYISGEFKLHDHYQYKWIKKEELLKYDLAPADIPLAKYILKN